jgi:hypothetical protein
VHVAGALRSARAIVPQVASLVTAVFHPPASLGIPTHNRGHVLRDTLAMAVAQGDVR